MAEITPVTMQGGKQYVMVADRIRAFHDKNKTYNIQTEIVHFDPNFAVMKATITDVEGNIATGHGRCTKEMASKAKGRFIEKAETTAIGRALSFLGFGTAELLEDEDDDYIADSPVETPRPKPVRGNLSPDETKELDRLFVNAEPDDEKRDAMIQLTLTKYNCLFLKDIPRNRFEKIKARLVEIATERVANGESEPESISGGDELADLMAKDDEEPHVPMISAYGEKYLRKRIIETYGKEKLQRRINIICKERGVATLSDLTQAQSTEILAALGSAQAANESGSKSSNGDVKYVRTDSGLFRRFQQTGQTTYGPNGWKERRPEIVSEVTGGRTETSKEMTVFEMQAGIEYIQFDFDKMAGVAATDGEV